MHLCPGFCVRHSLLETLREQRTWNMVNRAESPCVRHAVRQLNLTHRV